MKKFSRCLDNNSYLNNSVFIISTLLLFIYIVSNAIHTDEGWFWAQASAKNFFGYYRFPAFEDVPVFRDEFLFAINRSILQLYRIIEYLIPNPIVGIVIIRFSIFLFFVYSLYYYIKTIYEEISIKELLTFLLLIVLNPIIFGQLSVARDEIIISAFLLLFFSCYHRSIDTQLRKYQLLLLTAIILFLHWNGIILLGLVMLYGIHKSKVTEVLKLWTAGLIILLLFYFAFIDYNIGLYLKQFKFLLISESRHEKFILSFNSLFNYFISEIKYRYLLFNSIHLKAYAFYLLLTLIPVIWGIKLLLHDVRYRAERYYIIGMMIAFILLGNKYIGYLAYFFPIFLIVIASELKKKLTLNLTAVIISLLCSFILIWGIRFNLQQQKKDSLIISTIKSKISKGKVIYADFSSIIRLGADYKCYTIAEKAAIFKSNNIKLSNCIIVADQNNEIWKYILHGDSLISMVGNVRIGNVK